MRSSSVLPVPQTSDLTPRFPAPLMDEDIVKVVLSSKFETEKV